MKIFIIKSKVLLANFDQNLLPNIKYIDCYTNASADAIYETNTMNSTFCNNFCFYLSYPYGATREKYKTYFQINVLFNFMFKKKNLKTKVDVIVDTNCQESFRDYLIVVDRMISVFISF